MNVMDIIITTMQSDLLLKLHYMVILSKVQYPNAQSLGPYYPINCQKLSQKLFSRGITA